MGIGRKRPGREAGAGGGGGERGRPGGGIHRLLLSLSTLSSYEL